jgi:hypothetical protein
VSVSNYEKIHSRFTSISNGSQILNHQWICHGNADNNILLRPILTHCIEIIDAGFDLLPPLDRKIRQEISIASESAST